MEATGTESGIESATGARPRKSGQYRKTKIIVTVGPASRSKETLCRLIKAGTNVFRLNFSHGTHAEHSETLATIRAASTEVGIPVGVLQDLCGPKIRISEVLGGTIPLADKSSVILKSATAGAISDARNIYVETVDPIKVLKPGHHVLLADGIISLMTEEVLSDGVRCSVMNGANLRSKVGIAFPDSVVDLAATTPKDLLDLDWAIQNKIDFVAISFVRNAHDVLTIKEALKKAQAKIIVISKIERRTALENIHEIMDMSDGIMVARGDLGLEVPLEQVPLLQKRLIEESNYQGIPAIVATQMMHSMVSSLRPTRAEVSDIATAVMNGADALMLSEETAIGEHPVECVEYLDRIAFEAEQAFIFNEYKLRLRDSDRATVPDAVAYAAAAAAIKVNAAAIISCTETGNSARLLAKYRPQQPVYGASSVEATLRRMALFWGIIPISCTPTDTHHDEIETALKAVQIREGLLNGSRAVIIGGLTIRAPGSTSVLEIREMSFR